MHVHFFNDKKIKVKNIIKIAVQFAVMLPFLSLRAQFLGGNGNGDTSVNVSSITLSGEIIINIYAGGSGRGDNQALITEVFFSDNFLFLGGSGRGDVLASTSAIYLGDDMRYPGGSGRGEATAGITSKVLSQRVLWRGGVSSGNGSSSSRDSNWFPNNMPGPSDEVALENNSNGFNIELQGNMTFKSLDFNGSNKKVIVGNKSLTITDSVMNADANNYIRTNMLSCVTFTVPNNQYRLMPVGNSAYNPVTITNKTGVQDNFCVFVNDEVNSRYRVDEGKAAARASGFQDGRHLEAAGRRVGRRALDRENGLVIDSADDVERRARGHLHEGDGQEKRNCEEQDKA